MLILSQDGDPTDPSDAREGGTISFDWDTPVRLNQIGILDVDTYETGSTVVTYDANNSVIDTYDLQALGDNSFQIVSMNDINVSRMDVNFTGSAAITEIDFDNFYQNIGTVTVDGLSDSDSSSYFNPFVGPKEPAPQGVEPTEPGTGSEGGMRYEAEDLHLDGYKVEQADFASAGELVALNKTQGSASTTFRGNSGQYQLDVAAFDENDGESPVRVLVNGAVVGEWTLDRNLRGSRASAKNQVTQTFTVDLQDGDTIEIQGTKEDGERARLDYFELQPLTSQPTPTEPSAPTPAPTEAPFTGSEGGMRYEAEDLHLDGYKVEQADFASAGELVALDQTQGSASTTFRGNSGQYQLDVAAFDENDGESPVQVLVNGAVVGEWTLDRNLRGSRASAKNQVTQSFTVNLQDGDTIEIQGTKEDGERARLDYFELQPLTSGITAAAGDISGATNWIDSYPEDELLSGGLGADVFRFQNAPIGNDVVENFEGGVDKLLFDIDGIAAFEDLNVAHMGLETRITFSADGLSDSSVTLTGVNTLMPNDVLFGNYGI